MLKKKPKKVMLPTAKDVVSIRQQLGFRQAAFAAFIGVSVSTLRNWEQGTRQPQGAARSLLFVAKKVPDAFRQAFGKK